MISLCLDLTHENFLLSTMVILVSVCQEGFAMLFVCGFSSASLFIVDVKTKLVVGKVWAFYDISFHAQHNYKHTC